MVGLIFLIVVMPIIAIIGMWIPVWKGGIKYKKYQKLDTYIKRNIDRLTVLAREAEFPKFEISFNNLQSYNNYSKKTWFKRYKTEEDIDKLWELYYKADEAFVRHEKYLKFYNEMIRNINQEFYDYEMKQLKLHTPEGINEPVVYLILDYVSPAGRNSYHNVIKVTLNDIEEHISTTLSKSSGRSVERSKMSPKIRYNVLCRDEFKCAACGRTKDNCNLEVDHIVPVSKGGLTVYENLITLCFDCNRGKSDDMNEFWQRNMLQLAKHRTLSSGLENT